MGHGRGKSARYMEPPPAAPSYPNLAVAGLITPDMTGTFSHRGTYNEQPYYQRLDNAFYIWYSEIGSGWIINDYMGSYGLDPYFFGPTGPTGTYYPGGGASGNPIVTET